jgi:acid phosphatase
MNRTFLISLSVVLFIAHVYAAKYQNVDRIIVIIMENWSFDSLFGMMDGVNGLSKASNISKLQLDENNQTYTVLPQVQPGVPLDMPNGPFDLSPYINMSAKTIDLTHSFYAEQLQINGGAMNKFVNRSSAQGLVMSYYNFSESYLGQLAKNYTVFDNWFHPFFGGSWANHQWLITSIPCTFPNAPSEIVNVLDPNGVPIGFPFERIVTPDGFAVNTVYSSNPPYPKNYNASRALPLQNNTTIGDQLTNAHISWKWYAGGWNDAMNGNPDPSFQYHHQPFNYYANMAPGKPGRKNLQDEVDFFNDLHNNTLPQVSFYKPLGKYNMHPGYSIIGDESEQKLIQVMQAIMKSKYWNNCLVIITFDEHGGRWDHVSPPKVDRWGPGTRIPTIFVSPLVKKGYVESTEYDTTAIMKLIQDRYDLGHISTRDAGQNNFDQVFISYPNWLVSGLLIGAVLMVAIAVLIIAALNYVISKRQKENQQSASDFTDPNTRYYKVESL